ncbi:SET domain-containing protein [Parvularcula sp. LCG005]|uniref:SET domain-containing protein n=1 Tax=Parvularcula sp. LCG005 TaxID=3078805 RepID=UPI002941C66C|nr:SET domain-containing protein [Parvularcula sp. LCG005]WOI53423.1 SET domain-containing protein [Parvularcula sp. LCG005]
MMLIPAYLAPSSIEGLGVFSRTDIVKGQCVYAFDERFDRLIPAADIDSAEGPAKLFFERYTYALPDYPGYFVLDADEARFMNHADRPNCDFANHHAAIALEDIPAGTELTCDYRAIGQVEVYFQGPRHGVGAIVEERYLNAK